jgi:hypothetical protein
MVILPNVTERRRTVGANPYDQRKNRETVEEAANAAANAGRTSATVDATTFAKTFAEDYPEQVIAAQHYAEEVAGSVRLPPGFKAEVRVVDGTISSTTIFGSQLSASGSISKPGRIVQIHVKRTDKK